MVVPTTSSTPKLIGVLGSTGTTGSAVLRSLLAPNKKPSTGDAAIRVRALVRNVDKARKLFPVEDVEFVQIADFKDLDAVTKALKGVEALYAMTPPICEEQILLDAVAAQAAHVADVKHVVYLSSIDANPTSNLKIIRAHGVAENIYRHYDYALSILRASWFMDNFLTQTGGIYASSKSRDIPYIAASDIGRAAAALLLGPIPKTGKTATFNLYHPQVLSNENIAEVMTTSLGKDVAVVTLPGSTIAEAAVQTMGMSKFTADAMVELMEAGFDESYETANTLPGYKQIVGTDPISFEEFVKVNKAQFK
ncbi:uncharacterized protein EV422DRAFT_80597 [Fimicolochytrium jonesii]|uniref:uncharacterized protein n=1 Tax=Fimicolochytrium jonesii TaxID=1396493 RepID=UPI0022FE0341|nr:uncharacterized protein EV422DRAFT_80597 [Fimicolochytrium jonesii]KAI8820142.1 hypothetical protein EV422DRAFT_80597 [Fimicolochytrium jonesii]